MEGDAVNSQSRRKFSTTVYMSNEQREELQALAARTRVSMAEYVREGIDLVLAKYRLTLLVPKGPP